jgi:hypothetical protein
MSKESIAVRLTSGRSMHSISRNLKNAAKTNDGKLHIVPRANGWALKKEGAKVAYRVYSTKAAAIRKAKNLIKQGINSYIIIHNRNGRISAIEHVL